MAAPQSTNRLAGRWCLVTGASSGIGAGLAQALARRGAKLILTARRVGQLEEAAVGLRELGAEAVEVVGADLSIPTDVNKLAERVLDITRIPDGANTQEQGHGLYMLINNAGGGVKGMGNLSEGADPDEWDKVMQLNINSPMRLTRLLTPALLAAAKTGPPELDAPGHGAVVINIGSVAGIEPIASMGVYCASKYAIRGWSLCTYRELRPHNVKVTVIEPGYVDTPLVPQTAGDRRRMIKVDDIAAAVMMVVDSSIACNPEEIVLRPVLPVVPLA